jgi:hypothetical protein
MSLLDYLTQQVIAPGALAALIQAGSVSFALLLLLRFWRQDRRQQLRVAAREADALTDIADHAFDLVVAVSDAMRDEVNAQDFVESFDRRLLIDADLMLDSIHNSALPTLTLLRPLFDLRWTIERTLEIADWLTEIVEDRERTGWRETAGEMLSLAERAAVAADAFRRYSRSVRRG